MSSRLVIVSQTWPRGHFGGTEFQAAALAEQLARRGFNITIWTRRNTDPLTPAGARLEQFSASRALFAGQVAFRARREAPPVVLGLLVSSHTWALARCLPRSTRFFVKLGCSGTSGDVMTSLARPWGQMKLREVFSRADGIIVPEPTITEEAIAAGCPAEKIHLIPNGADLDRFRSGTVPEKIVLFVGRLEPQKGADLLPAIWSDPPPGWRLRIVGDGSLRASLAAWAGTRADVELVPFTPEVESHYRSARLLLLPSRAEGLPNVMLEALACGLGVIAADIPAVRFVNEQTGNHCLVVGANDPAAWRAALQRAVIVPPQPADLREFSLERTTERYAALLDR